jgi:hypothetical protein
MYKTLSASIDGDILFKVDLNMAKGDKDCLFSKIHVLPLLLRNLKRKSKADSGTLIGELQQTKRILPS